MMPTVTKNLIIINVLVFFGTLVAQRYGLDLTNYLGLHFFLASDFNPAQLITYMFMHGGFSHIFFNMFAVFMFGPILEQTWGPKRFLFYYIILGFRFHVFFWNRDTNPSKIRLIHEVKSTPLLRLAANQSPASAPPKWAICPPALLEVIDNTSIPITTNARYLSRIAPNRKSCTR